MTTFGSAHVRSATAPRARPMPEPLTPPHGTCGALRATRWSFIQTMPTCSSRAMRAPLKRSAVHTDAPSPSGEAFARRIASSSVSRAMDDEHRARRLLVPELHPGPDAGDDRGREERAADARRRDRAAAVDGRAVLARVVDERDAAGRGARARRAGRPRVPAPPGRRPAARAAIADDPLEEPVVDRRP